MNHRSIHPSFTGGGQGFVLLAETAKLAKPSQSTFHHPAFRQKVKTSLVDRWFDNLDGDTEPVATPSLQVLTLVATIQQQRRPAREQGDVAQQATHSDFVLDIGRQHQPTHQPALTIDEEVPFASLYSLAPVVATWPPFSVVLLDWLSPISKLGAASRPAWRRTCSRKASLSCCHTPRRLSIRKYEYTVCHAGKSCGKARQLMPPRSTYQMASSNSRGLCSRGRPVRCSGSSGASCSHAASCRSLGYVFRVFIALVYHLNALLKHSLSTQDCLSTSLPAPACTDTPPESGSA